VPSLSNLREIFNIYFRDGIFAPYVLSKGKKGDAEPRMRSILSLISKLENCSTESTPLFGYVGVTPPPQGVISSSIATSEDSFRTTKSERALQANQKIVRIVCKILLAVFKAKVE
jgi:hypothetical protein